MKAQDGSVAHARLLGGKGHLQYNPDGSMSYTYTNEKSFQHGMQAVVALGTAGFSYLTTKAQELTTQLQNANLTQIQRDQIAANLQTTIAQINATTKATFINAGIPKK